VVKGGEGRGEEKRGEGREREEGSGRVPVLKGKKS
jgi:hypothetical protein